MFKLVLTVNGAITVLLIIDVDAISAAGIPVAIAFADTIADSNSSIGLANTGPDFNFSILLEDVSNAVTDVVYADSRECSNMGFPNSELAIKGEGEVTFEAVTKRPFRKRNANV
jgi:hypothetical protein